jgi:hypothetical protein
MKGIDFIVQGVYTKKCPDFGVLKNRQMEFFWCLMISCVLQEFKYQPTFLGYLTGHRWGRPTLLT